MSESNLVEPYGCGRCGIPEPHGRQAAADGIHTWERPSDAQVLARMKARRLARAVARMGALPMPGGPELTPDREREIQSLDLLAMMPERSAAVVSGHLAALLGEVTRLRAERHATNEALDDVVRELRRMRPRTTAQRPVEDDVTPQVQKLRTLLAGQREAVDGEHYASVHHAYRVGRDLPPLGGVQ